MAPESTARITASHDRERDLTTVTVEGAVNADQVRNQIVGFLSGEPTRFVIWDYRQGSLSRLSAEDLRSIISAGAPFAYKRRGGRTAIVCAHELDYGLSRMYQIIAELHHIPFEIDVFRDMQSALKWLGIDPRPS